MSVFLCDYVPGLRGCQQGKIPLADSQRLSLDSQGGNRGRFRDELLLGE